MALNLGQIPRPPAKITPLGSCRASREGSSCPRVLHASCSSHNRHGSPKTEIRESLRDRLRKIVR